jgi:hypothetical protein
MQNSKRIGRSYAAAFTIAASLALGALGATSAQALDTHYPPDGDNPLRIVYYFVAPVGTVLEWTVTRPLAIMGNYVAPYSHIDRRGFTGCSRERPARSCTYVVK